MPRIVTINSGVRDVVMPNGIRYGGGAVVTLSDQDYSKLSATFKAATLASDTAVAGSDYFTTQGLASGESCIPRLNVGSTVPLVSGTMLMSYWTAVKTETVNNIGFTVGNTAAGATPTYCAMACYKAAADNSLTLLGACASDTTIFNVAFATVLRAVLTPFQKVQGQRYAFGILCVSAASMPTIEGYNGTVTLSGNSPVLSKTEVSQSSIPASVTAGNLSGTSSSVFGYVTP